MTVIYIEWLYLANPYGWTYNSKSHRKTWEITKYGNHVDKVIREGRKALERRAGCYPNFHPSRVIMTRKRFSILLRWGPFTEEVQLLSKASFDSIHLNKEEIRNEY